MYVLNKRNGLSSLNKEWQNYYGNLCYPKTRVMRQTVTATPCGAFK